MSTANGEGSRADEDFKIVPRPLDRSDGIEDSVTRVAGSERSDVPSARCNVHPPASTGGLPSTMRTATGIDTQA